MMTSPPLAARASTGTSLACLFISNELPAQRGLFTLMPINSGDFPSEFVIVKKSNGSLESELDGWLTSFKGSSPVFCNVVKI